jgi:tetrahydromethanopterin S-methyltransferase subunit E
MLLFFSFQMCVVQLAWFAKIGRFANFFLARELGKKFANGAKSSRTGKFAYGAEHIHLHYACLQGLPPSGRYDIVCY